MIKKIFPFLALLIVCGCAGSRPVPQKAETEKSAPYYYILSDLQASANEPSAALSSIDQAVAKEPNEPRVWYRHALLNVLTGSISNAEDDLQKALQFDPDDVQSLILLGKIYQSQNKRDKALGCFQKALRIDPSSEEANILLLENYVAEKKYSAALALTRNWASRAPEEVDPLFYEAWIQQSFFKNIPGAVSAYDRVLILEPENMKALAALADIYIVQKNTVKLLAVFRKMEALSPNDPSIQLKIALIYYDHQEYDQAIEKFKGVLKTHPDADRVIYYLGVIYENLNRDPEAFAQFEKIPSSSSFFKDARLHMAFLKKREKNEKEAIRILEQAVRIKPDSPALYQYLAEIYRESGKYEQAIDTLKKGISKSREKTELYYSLGLADDRAGRSEDAIAAMRQVLKLDPENASAMNYIGYSYAEQGVRLDEALDLLKKAVELRPTDGYIVDSLGWVYFKKGDLPQASAYIRKAYALVPDEPTVSEHLGEIALKKNEKKEALKYFNAALSFLKNKETPEAVKDRVRIEEKIGALK
jgi:tetratricopeptide (TPR) repeat protein